MPELEQTGVIMNVAEGYLEMLRGDLQHAIKDENSELVAELMACISQVEEVQGTREDINRGVAEEIFNGREAQLNEEINLINEEFIADRMVYLEDLVADNMRRMNSLGDGDDMVVDHEAGLAIYPSGIFISLVTGAMYCFSEQI